MVEAKAEGEQAETGFEKTKRYARDLGLAFAYATNGHAIIEYDFFTHSSRTLDSFPTPRQLWERWAANTGPSRPTDAHEVAEAEVPYGSSDRQRSPLLHPYCPESVCGMTPFYFQEVAIDPDDPDSGTWHPPAYQYSFGQGIEDGFLATYKVHRVRTTVDRDGVRLEDALEQGAEVFIPEDVDPRDEYNTPQFEREITLPDRTRTMAQHLAGLLRRFGHMDKTMVFCVDMAHARLVARLLQDAFGPETGLDGYAVPIISEEGEEGRRALESLADSDKPTPVVATTAELLSTGVDVPPCRNIVFMKTISSPILFKQIVGRGCRQDPATDKYWFRIIDYTGATRLFDLLSHIAFRSPVVTRGERAAAFRNLHQRFLQRYSDDARRVILELLEKYRSVGIAEIDPAIFSVSPFAEWGGAVTIARWFGGVDQRTCSAAWAARTRTLGSSIPRAPSSASSSRSTSPGSARRSTTPPVAPAASSPRPTCT